MYGWKVNGIEADKLPYVQLMALCEAEALCDTRAQHEAERLNNPEDLDTLMLAREAGPEFPFVKGFDLDPEWIEVSDTQITLSFSEELELTFHYHEMPERFANLERAVRVWYEHSGYICRVDATGYADDVRLTHILFPGN